MPDKSKEQELTEIINGLVEVRNHIGPTLEKHGMAMLAITANQNLSRLIAMLNQTIGNGANTAPLETIQFPPVTNFMGEEIKRPLEIKAEDLSPKEFAKQQFLQKIKDLEETIDNRENKDILEAFPLPSDQTVIRGLAKQAGVTSYKDAEINSDFLDMIRAGLEAKATLASKNKKTEDKIKAAGNNEDEDLK